jgi:hypothetical protein
MYHLLPATTASTLTRSTAGAVSAIFSAEWLVPAIATGFPKPLSDIVVKYWPTEAGARAAVQALVLAVPIPVAVSAGCARGPAATAAGVGGHRARPRCSVLTGW